ncbi:hypothetical protein CC2G_006847 [Coprinopsis cinerea AmutBmut pab1-1]|nr:hypothetical protein CC2G_006847 [Coprinopsis cinerea AmutBmut pab1-1]
MEGGDTKKARMTPNPIPPHPQLTSTSFSPGHSLVSNAGWNWPGPHPHHLAATASTSAPMRAPMDYSMGGNVPVNPATLGLLQQLFLAQQVSHNGGMSSAPSGFLTPGLDHPSLGQSASNINLDPNVLYNMLNQQNQQQFGGGQQQYGGAQQQFGVVWVYRELYESQSAFQSACI